VNFSLTTLGTASARPLVDKHQSAHVFNLHGRLLLVDCGEGTQIQLIRFGISLSKIDNIFISHTHGDHVFGIFGLLSTMILNGRTAPLFIYAPRDFGSILNFFVAHFGEGLKFEIHHTPLTMHSIEKIVEFRRCEVSAFPLNHRIDCYGFLVKEKLSPNIPATPEGCLPMPRSAAYCSDTAPFAPLEQWLKGVDLLFHEATFAQEHTELAAKTYHSTAAQAARLASSIEARKLVIGHFSSRYLDPSILLSQAQEIFPETSLACEGTVFEIKTLLKPVDNE